jgi:hypothetical protein
MAKQDRERAAHSQKNMLAALCASWLVDET